MNELAVAQTITIAATGAVAISRILGEPVTDRTFLLALFMTIFYGLRTVPA